MPLQSGTTLGQYTITTQIGAGGMGEVYRARDTKLQRDVAIKLLSADLAESRERLERLQREARLLASVDHPNINTIYAVEEVDGAHFLVLQLVEGTTLADRLAAGRIPLDSLLPIALQIAEALEAAHAKGIVHRDLKPSNVMVSDDVRVKVLDFGIAKTTPADGAVDASAAMTQSELTRAGTVVGTAPYMSPEQLRGGAVDARTDIWAFGCVLYEMLAGRRAFAGDTIADASAAVIARDPDWGALPDAVPDALKRLTQRCLRKDAAERLHAVADARIELREMLGESRTSSSASGGRPASTDVAEDPSAVSESGRAAGPPTMARTAAVSFWPGLAFVAVIAVFVFGVPTYRSIVGDRSSPVERSYQLADQLLATVAPGSHRQPTLSPDGSTMAFVSDSSSIPRIYVQTLTEGAAPIPITDEEAPAFHPSWSPSNDQIAFHRPGDGIWTVGPLGTPAPRRIIESGINPSFSADGGQIVYERFPSVWIANADGTGQRPVAGADLLMPTAVQNVAQGFPALSPDGESIVYFRSASGPMGDFWVIPAAGGDPRRLTFDTNQGSHPIWTPDGQHVIFSSLRSGSRTLWRVPAAGGDPEPVTSGAGEDSEPALSRDGRRLVYANVRNEKAMMIYDPEVGESREIITRRYGLVLPRFSPDGNLIAFFGEVAGGTELFVVGADGQGMRQVTRGDGQFNIHPRWAADGSVLYFYRDNPYREDSPGAFFAVSPAGGPGNVVLADFYWDRNMSADVHPDEDAVVYLRRGTPESGNSTVVRDLESGSERPLRTPARWDSDRPFSLEVPRWSHDGRFLTGSDRGRFWRPPDAAGSTKIWLCTADGVCEPVIDGFLPIWSADDSQIYFQRPAVSPDNLVVWVADRDGRNARPVTEIGPLHFIDRLFDVAPNGRLVWVEYRPGSPEIWSADVE